MEIEFQLLDCDYITNTGPIVRLFGKTKEGKTVCGFYHNYCPYFYVLVKEGNEKELINLIIEKFKSLIKNVEPVKKFLPVGYQSEEKNLLKITLTDPSRVPEVRESLQKNKDIKDVYEADILFKYRFMADKGIFGFKWVRAKGRFSNTTTVKTDITFDIDSLEDIEKQENIDLRYLSVDIETISEEGVPDAKKDIIGIISLTFYPAHNNKSSLVLVAKPLQQTNNNVKTFRNEKEMLEEFLKIIEHYDPDILVGYNINNFDFPYLLARLRENKLSVAFSRDKTKPGVSRKIAAHYRNSLVGRVIVDSYDLVKESIRKGTLRLKRLGLGEVSRELLGDEKIDISHSEIIRHWEGSREQVNKLIEYAQKDSQLALQLILKNEMLDKFFELSKVSGLLLQDCLDGGEAQRVENLLLREFNKHDYVLPCKPSEGEIKEDQEVKGALVLEPKLGLHTDSIVYLDFKAMYPSIFISYNICPTTFVKDKPTDIEFASNPYGTKFVSKHIQEGIIPLILKRLINERDKIRKLEKSADEDTKRILEAKQLALKIMTNAFYGYTGYMLARLYVPEIANTITGCGRFLINKTKEIIEKNTDHQVVYGDTDSIMVRVDVPELNKAFSIGQELESLVNKELQGIVEIKIEKVFKSLLILSKKRYAGLSYEKVNGEWKEEIVMKGIETVRRDWCDATTKILFDVLNILLKEQNPKKAFTHVKEFLVKLERNEVPIEDLVITKSISKSISSYKGIQPHIELVKKLKKRNGSAPGVGDRVSFVIVKGMQLLSERAEDPEYVKVNKIPIDSKYYIESQILPPLERVFEVLGVSKTELLGIGRQTLLKELFKNNANANGGIKESLDSFNEFICNRCNKSYRRATLTGRCFDCSGELFFSSAEGKSRILSYKEV